MNYSFHPHAEKELEEVENYYDGISEDLGDRFRAQIEMALSGIIKFPNAWQPLTKTVRRRNETGTRSPFSVTGHLHHEHQIFSGH